MRSAPRSSQQNRVGSVNYLGFKVGLRTTTVREIQPSSFFLKLQNLVPYPEGLRVRKGYRETAALDGSVTGMFVGRLGSFNRVFVTTSSGLYDCTDYTTPVLLRADIKQGNWSYTQYGNPAGAFVCAVNGSNKILIADKDQVRLTGEGDLPALSVDPLASPEVPNLKNIISFKGRLWLSAANSLDLYYLDPLSITGELTLFTIGTVANKGGVISGLSSWTIDAGAGIDDHLLVLTSEGQLLVYKGIDPNSSASFSLVGVYQTSKPVGNNPFLQFAGDTLIMTTAGILSVRSLFEGGAYERNLYLTDSFKDVWTSHTRLTGDNKDWAIHSIAEEGLLLINAPTLSAGVFTQYIFDSLTQQWSIFTNWPIQYFAPTLGAIYGVSYSSKFCIMFSGYRDNGQAIPVELITSFSAFNSPSHRKRVTMGRPRIEGTEVNNSSLVYLTDMNLQQPPNAVEFNFLQSLWGEAIWGEDVWAGRQVAQAWLTGLGGFGFYIAVWFKADVKGDFLWRGIDINYERGTML